jgi:thiol:disulfide interchange protein DsbA
MPDAGVILECFGGFKVIRKFLSVMLLCLPLWACAEESPAGDYREGIDYAAVLPPLPAAAEGKVKVVELFWYGCPHCFQFEPYLQQWKQEKPANVEFERIPAVFKKADGSVNPGWEIMARAYYTADVMGVLDTIHPALFDAIHVKRQRPYSAEALRALFVAQGVDGATFDATFNSFAVNGLVANAINKTQQYAIDGVPALAVQGKYRIGPRMAGSYANMINITNYLVAKEGSAGALAKKEAVIK